MNVIISRQISKKSEKENKINRKNNANTTTLGKVDRKDVIDDGAPS